MTMLAYQITPAVQIISHSATTESADDSAWLRYFNPQAAMSAVAAHVAALPSSRTAEQHTRHAYESGLRYFLDWAGLRLPTADLIGEFIAHLSLRNLKVSTINAKYLAPTRLYLRKLSEQRITSIDPAVRMIIDDAREHMRAAAAVPSPRAEITTNIAPLWRADFTRLTLAQVNAVLRGIDRSTLIGLRDYALLHVAFSTGLRLAELSRITPASITQQGDVYIITVRGKRSNVDPVPITRAAFDDVQRWIVAYNACLDDGDPRRITAHTSIWQPLTRSGRVQSPTVPGFVPSRGMSHQALRDLIARRAGIAAHDTRRTAAAIAYDAGMDITDIQQLLRHKDAAVTLHYVGKKPDFASRSLGTRVQFG